MFETGHVDIGYDIGKRRLFKMRMKERIAFGVFNVTFSRNSIFIYKSANQCEGYSIRRKMWHEILKDNDDSVVMSLKQKVLK